MEEVGKGQRYKARFAGGTLNDFSSSSYRLRTAHCCKGIPKMEPAAEAAVLNAARHWLAPFLACRHLTCLTISSSHIEALPLLPPQLQQLDVENCIKLRSLPALPATLRKLLCSSCSALEALPKSLSSPAVAELNCDNCELLKDLPELPQSLVELSLEYCRGLLQLPALPEGLKDLCVKGCEELRAVSSSCWAALACVVVCTAWLCTLASLVRQCSRSRRGYSPFLAVVGLLSAALATCIFAGVCHCQREKKPPCRSPQWIMHVTSCTIFVAFFSGYPEKSLMNQPYTPSKV